MPEHVAEPKKIGNGGMYSTPYTTDYRYTYTADVYRCFSLDIMMMYCKGETMQDDVKIDFSIHYHIFLSLVTNFE
jgi:hypothetical protein